MKYEIYVVSTGPNHRYPTKPDIIKQVGITIHNAGQCTDLNHAYRVAEQWTIGSNNTWIYGVREIK